MSLRFPVRVWWAIIGLAAALAVGGCSALRLAYGQAPNLAFWWLDAYVDFDGAQSTLVRDGIDRWFAWHRRTQLADYVQLLDRAAGEAAADTSAEQLCAWWPTLVQRRDTALRQMAEPAAALALTLTPDQVRHVERHMRRKNDDARDDYLPDDPQDRERASFKRALERLESLYGPLDAGQREALAAGLKRTPWNPSTHLADRERRQQALLSLVRRWQGSRPAADTATREMQALLLGLYRPQDDAAQRYQREVLAHNCTLAAQMHNQATPAQRRHLVDKLRGWAADLRAVLAASAG